MSKLKFSWFQDGKLQTKSVVIFLALLPEAIAIIGGILFYYSFGKSPTLSDGKAWSFWQYSERGRDFDFSPKPSSPSLDLLN